MTGGRGKAWAMFALKGVVSVALLGLAVYLLDWRRLVEVTGALSVGAVGRSAALTTVLFVVLGVRWWLMVRRAAPIGFSPHLSVYLAANLINSFTPANLGGDAYRVIVLRRFGVTAELIVLIVRERLLGLAGFFSVYLLCVGVMWATMPTLRGNPAHALNVGALAAAAGLAAIVSGRWLTGRLMRAGRGAGWVADWIADRPRTAATLKHADAAFRFESPGQAVVLMALTYLPITLWSSAAWVIAQQLAPEVSFATVAAVIVFGEVIRLVPISIQGVGVREGVWAFAFSALGHDPAVGFAVGAAAYLVLSAVLLFTGVVGWAATAAMTRRLAAPAADTPPR